MLPRIPIPLLVLALWLGAVVFGNVFKPEKKIFTREEIRQMAQEINGASTGSEVVLFSAEYCSSCKALSRELTKRDIPYVLAEIDKNSSAASYYALVQSVAIPTTLVGSEVFIGYQPDQIARAFSNLD